MRSGVDSTESVKIVGLEVDPAPRPGRYRDAQCQSRVPIQLAKKPIEKSLDKPLEKPLEFPTLGKHQKLVV